MSLDLQAGGSHPFKWDFNGIQRWKSGLLAKLLAIAPSVWHGCEEERCIKVYFGVGRGLGLNLLHTCCEVCARPAAGTRVGLRKGTSRLPGPSLRPIFSALPFSLG